MDVLIAHGGEESRRGLANALAPLGFRITQAADGADALEALLAQEVPRIALVDWDLPRIEGPELCRLVRDFHVEDPPYVILLAGAPTATSCPPACRPVRTTACAPRSPRRSSRRASRWPAASWSCRWGGPRRAAPTRSPGCCSREEAVQRLDDELSRARREHQELGIGILDVDGLRARQRAPRPVAGDAVLREVVRRAQRLASALRRGRPAGRRGVPDHPVKHERTAHRRRAARLREAMSSEPFSHEDRELEVTVHAGWRHRQRGVGRRADREGTALAGRGTGGRAGHGRRRPRGGAGGRAGAGVTASPMASLRIRRAILLSGCPSTPTSGSRREPTRTSRSRRLCCASARSRPRPRSSPPGGTALLDEANARVVELSGLPFTVHGPFLHFEYGSRSQRHHRAALEVHRRHLAVAAELGARVYVVASRPAAQVQGLGSARGQDARALVRGARACCRRSTESSSPSRTSRSCGTRTSAPRATSTCAALGSRSTWATRRSPARSPRGCATGPTTSSTCTCTTTKGTWAATSTSRSGAASSTPRR